VNGVYICRGGTENIFADAVETALLFVPKAELCRVETLATSFRLAPVDSIDELALELLHKPQYPSEILRDTAAGQRLGLSHPSPLAERLLREQTEVVEAQAAALDRLARLHAAENAVRAQTYTDEIESHQRAHSKRVVALTTSHAEKLRALAREVETAHEALAAHERALAAL